MLQKLQARIEELTKQLDQVSAQYNATFGALGEARNMLAILESESQKTVDESHTQLNPHDITT